LGAQAGTDALPYLAQFAEIDWHLGRLALATDDSPQVHVMHLDWSLDELMAIFLTENAPEQFALALRMSGSRFAGFAATCG